MTGKFPLKFERSTEAHAICIDIKARFYKQRLHFEYLMNLIHRGFRFL
jgi:hypothetical protein